MKPIEEKDVKTFKIQGVIHTTILNLPNGGLISAPDITRALFVKKDTEMNFENDRLSEYKSNKPSEALGFAMISYNLAHDIISIPSELFKLRLASAASDPATPQYINSGACPT
jgi:hypothetical protein